MLECYFQTTDKTTQYTAVSAFVEHRQKSTVVVVVLDCEESLEILTRTLNM